MSLALAGLAATAVALPLIPPGKEPKWPGAGPIGNQLMPSMAARYCVVHARASRRAPKRTAGNRRFRGRMVVVLPSADKMFGKLHAPFHRSVGQSSTFTRLSSGLAATTCVLERVALPYRPVHFNDGEQSRID